MLQQTEYAAHHVRSRLADLSEEDAQKICFQWQHLNCRNAQIASYSDVLSSLLGCNNNPILLGVDTAAKAALFYLIKYVTKDSTQPCESASVLIDAKEHCDKWESTAEDAATNPY